MIVDLDYKKQIISIYNKLLCKNMRSCLDKDFLSVVDSLTFKVLFKVNYFNLMEV